MKDEGDFHVLLEDHLKALRFDDNQRKAAMDILADADALVNENGEEHISVRAYTGYILFRLSELGDLAKQLQSLDDLRNYETLTRGFLHEWAIIIGNISHLIAKGHGLDSIESGKTLETLIGDMGTMFEHLVDANKLFIEFGHALKDNSTGSQT